MLVGPIYQLRAPEAIPTTGVGPIYQLRAPEAIPTTGVGHSFQFVALSGAGAVFMGIRAKQLLAGTLGGTGADLTNARAAFGVDLFDSTLATSVFTAGAIPGAKIANSGITATQLATSVAGNGITGGGGTALAVNPDSTTGGNTAPVSVAANGVGLDISSIAGTSLEADGSANLRIAAAAAGAGLTGGGASALAVGAGTGITVNASDVAIDTTSIVTFVDDPATAWTFPVGTTAQGLFVTGTPADANHVVNKAYADSLVSGLQWKDPVHVKEMIGSDAALDIEAFSPATGDAYVIDTANGAGALSTAVVGDIWEWSGSAWNLILAGSGGFVAAGARGLASIQTALNGTIGLVDTTDDGKILDWDGTSLTPTKTVSLAGDALLVTDQDNDGDSVFANLGYTFQGAVPTGVWTQFTGAGQINAGTGLTKTGNTINAIGGFGITANANDLAVNPDSTTGANIQPVNVVANGVGVDIAAIAGTGIEADGSANLRLAAQGNGISGGAGSTLSVNADGTTGGNIQPVNVVANGVGVDIAAIAGTGIEADGSANLRLAAQGNGIAGGGGSTLSVLAANTSISVTGSGISVVAAQLIQGGTAEIDGDLIDIDYLQTNYTPATAGIATDVNHLAAHLEGIDNALGTLGAATTKQQQSITPNAITGTDTAISTALTATPVPAPAGGLAPILRLYLNGIFQAQGAGADYTIAGTTITWLASSGTAVDTDTSDLLVAIYESA